MSAVTAAILVLTLQAAQTTAPGTSAGGLPLEGAAAEEFLKTAKIGSVGNFPTNGVTRPKKVELSDGERTLFAVFKTIEVAAQALPQLVDRHAQRITALELVLLTQAGSAAGQFVLTPEMADQLNSGETEVAAFFVREVQF